MFHDRNGGYAALWWLRLQVASLPAAGGGEPRPGRTWCDVNSPTLKKLEIYKKGLTSVKGLRSENPYYRERNHQTRALAWKW